MIFKKSLAILVMLTASASFYNPIVNAQNSNVAELPTQVVAPFAAAAETSEIKQSFEKKLPRVKAVDSIGPHGS